MSSLSISQSARNSMLDWFQERGFVNDAEALRLLREDQGLENSRAGLTERVAQDFGMEAAKAFDQALDTGPQRPFPRWVLVAVPDDWFARAVELLVEAHDEALAEHYVINLLSSVVPASGAEEMVNRALKANRCPWEMVEGKMQPLGDPAMATAVSRQPTGWPEVDREVRGLVDELREAEYSADINALGARILRLLISVTRIIDISPYLSDGEPEPGPDDVKARLALFFEHAAVGPRFAQLRGPIRDDLVKRAYTQAETVKHSRNADATDAQLAVSLALSVVDLVRIVDDA